MAPSPSEMRVPVPETILNARPGPIVPGQRFFVEAAGAVTAARATVGLARRRVCAHCEVGSTPEAAVAQTNSRFFDEVGRLMNDAAGVASGVRREFDTVMRTQAERILRALDVVQREEVEAVKEMARLAREENEALKARIAALEAKLKGTPSPGGTDAGNG